MESIRVPFKKDDYGNDMFVRLAWSHETSKAAKPIGEAKQHATFYIVLTPSKCLYSTAADSSSEAQRSSPNLRLSGSPRKASWSSYPTTA